MEQESTGVVIFYDADRRGFGFIKPDSGGKDLFFHVSSILTDEEALKAGDSVQYVVKQGEKGPMASDVALIEKDSGNVEK